MPVFLNKISYKTNFLNFLFCLIPASFIAGNLVLNINVILLVITTIIFFKKDLIIKKIDLLDKLILIFFSFMIFTGLYNNINSYFFIHEPHTGNDHDTTVIVKSVSYLRYLLLYFVVRYLVENKIINLKFFFISSSVFGLFVCFDLFYQFLFGKDIFGFEGPTIRKYSGPFGDELIAGGYLQRFSIFSFFLLPIFFNINKRIILNISILLIFFIFLTSIIISGNRMPFILFLFTLFLIILFEKKTRKYLFLFFSSSIIIFLLIFNFNYSIKVNFLGFYDQAAKILMAGSDKISKKNEPLYLKEFETFYDTWLINKYIGGGIKSFRRNCHLRDNIDPNSKFICNTHPHNYYLEILTDLGLIGLCLILLIFFRIFYISFFKKYFTDNHLKSNHVITPFIFIFLVEIFPIKSTGSFFTTGNATFLFLIMAIIVALAKDKNLN